MDKANSILVVGECPTRIEAAGCLLMCYKVTKKVGIANSGNRLLNGLPELASKDVQEYFEKHGVNIYLNTKFDS